MSISIFPTITEKIQCLYEDFAFLNGDVKYKEDIPCICGYYGRACRHMNDMANSVLCTNCLLSNFASVVEAAEEYCKLKGCKLQELNKNSCEKIHVELQNKVVRVKIDFIEDVINYLKQRESTYQNFYFAFGSDRGFPYQYGYLIVQAANMPDAVRKFRKDYPDRYENCLNCAFVYTQEQWNKLSSDMGKCHKVI